MLEMRSTYARAHIAPNSKFVERTVGNAPARQPIQGLYLPSHIKVMDHISRCDEFTIASRDVRFHTATGALPQLATTLRSRRWLGEWVPPPHIYGAINKPHLLTGDQLQCYHLSLSRFQYSLSRDCFITTLSLHNNHNLYLDLTTDVEHLAGDFVPTMGERIRIPRPSGTRP